MITLRCDNILQYKNHEIDVTDFPRGIPYDITLNDNAIRLIPWMDATTRRVAVNHLPGGWFTADGWLLIGVYCRNPYECSRFEHMYFTMPYARTQIGAMEEPLRGYEWIEYRQRIDGETTVDITL